VTPWVILHGVIAFGGSFRVYDAEESQDLNAIDYLLNRATYEGRRIFRESDGEPTLPPRTAYFQVQDHVDQVLMALAEAGVPLERKLTADTGRRFTIADVVSASQKGFKPEQELGWTLVALSTYVPFQQEWTGARGRRYRTEDLVRLAIGRDPRRETEGGSHHLYGVAYALRRYGSQTGRMTPVWREARTYLDRYTEWARRDQGPDGAFSAAIFGGARAPRSARELVSTTGHMLEWLTVALEPRELGAAWVERAADRLCREMAREPLEVLTPGGIYHATNALRRYRAAWRGVRRGLPADPIAASPK
jgi:hypothetical protein